MSMIQPACRYPRTKTSTVTRTAHGNALTSEIHASTVSQVGGMHRSALVDVRKLNTNHRQLLLQGADDFDLHVLGSCIELAESIYTFASAFGHLGEVAG